jgi:transcriptional regulator with XRE-family HTH domain
MTLGERIKENRNRLGFSQEKIAELVDVSRQAVTKWEANQSIPCMENLITLADIFGISLSELSGNTDKKVLNMRAVKSSWRTYGKITLILGAAFFAAMIVVLITFDIWAFNFGIFGAVCFLLGIIFAIIAQFERNKLKRLKNEGLRYDAKIERITRNHYGIRIGSILSGYAECSYLNQDGEKRLVKSSSFILEDQYPEYNVSVYVKRNNPKDYAVELNIISS